MTGGGILVSSAPENRNTRCADRFDVASMAPLRSKRRVARTRAWTSVAPSATRHNAWKMVQPHTDSAVITLPCAQKYGPPAITPAPLTTLECATSNCTAMYAPEDTPETDVRAMSTLKAGKGAGPAAAGGESNARTSSSVSAMASLHRIMIGEAAGLFMRRPYHPGLPRTVDPQLTATKKCLQLLRPPPTAWPSAVFDTMWNIKPRI